MKANIVDLRYKMKDVLKALERKERVEIVYLKQNLPALRGALIFPKDANSGDAGLVLKKTSACF